MTDHQPAGGARGETANLPGFRVPLDTPCANCKHDSGDHNAFREPRRCTRLDCPCREFVPAPRPGLGGGAAGEEDNYGALQGAALLTEIARLLEVCDDCVIQGEPAWVPTLCALAAALGEIQRAVPSLRDAYRRIEQERPSGFAAMDHALDGLEIALATLARRAANGETP